MSLCFRTISNKLPPFVSTRKQVAQLDRQLPKQLKSSTFLEEFLGIKIITSSTSGIKNNAANSVIPYSPQILLNDYYKNFKGNMELLNNQQKQEIIQGISEYKSETSHIHCNRSKEVKNVSLEKYIELYETSNLQKQYFSQKFLNHKKDIEIQNINDDKCFFSQLKEAEKEEDTVQSDTKNVTIMSTDSLKKALKAKSEQNSEREKGRPSLEQLEKIREQLSYELPRLFCDKMDYNIYEKDMIFVNNIRGTVTKGFINYYKQITLLRIIGHIKYAYIKLDLLKITAHPEDDSIKVRWRIRGISGITSMLKFWKFKFWNIKTDIQDQQECWHDGFSTFYVNAQGKIHKHIADKMMPDSEVEIDKQKPDIPVKLAVCVGVTDLDIGFYNLLINIKRTITGTETKHRYLDFTKN